MARFRRKITFRKRTFGRKRMTKKRMQHRRNNPSTALVRNPTGLSDTLFLKLKFVNTYKFTLMAGVTASTQVMSGNSIFNCDVTNANGLPMGFRQWLGTVGTPTMYQDFFVKASKIQFDFSGSDGIMFYLYPTTTNSPTTDPTRILEQPNCKYLMTSSGKGRQRLKHYYTTAKSFGSKYIQNDDSTFTGTVGTTPSNQWLWMCGCYNADALAGANIELAVITVTYYVQLFNKVYMPVSS